MRLSFILLGGKVFVSLEGTTCLLSVSLFIVYELKTIVGWGSNSDSLSVI